MADVTLQITIPEAHTGTVLDALNKTSGASLSISAQKFTENKVFDSEWRFMYEPKGATETNKQFSVRAILELVKALVKMVDYAEDQDRYRTAVTAIPQAEQDVPDDIITGE